MGVETVEVSARQVANYFVELSSKTDENDLTNLKLQKLLYFAQGKYIAEKGKKLFGEPIEAWKLGPVVRSIYNTFKHCGPYPITAFDEGVEKARLPDEIKDFLSQIWENYNKYSAGHLVDLTHRRGTPWQIVYSESEDKEIPADLMKHYFSIHKS
ncbi:MAG: type II toxin-antitoxin system antitoxin SocA domain-containing protein [Patescibacteria group bacterium]